MMGGAIARAAAVLLAAGATALAAAGCGSGAGASPEGLRLQREDLIAVSRALASMRGQVAAEVAATKQAWPHVANGLPAQVNLIPRRQVDLAARQAGALRPPGIFGESQAAGLTGPASSLAGLFSSYAGLSGRGWQMIGGAIDQIERGSPAARSFAKANVALYIESVYDAHFGLAQIGRKLRDGYRSLGGGETFGASLTEAEVNRLADFYSEEQDRLHPHVGVRLGS